MTERDDSKYQLISSEDMTKLLDKLQKTCYELREEISDEDETNIINPVLNWIDNYDVKKDPLKEKSS